MVFQRELEGKEQASADVVSGTKRQRLAVYAKADEATLVLTEGGVKMRSWPLHAVRVNAEQPGGTIIIEAGGETLTFMCGDETARKALSSAAAAALAAESGRPLADAALEVLLEDAAPDDADAELWVKRLAERLAKLDALNVSGMLAAATEGGGAKLADRLEAGVAAGTALSTRLSRYDNLIKGAVGATQARSGAARADANARALLAELDELFKWLDAPILADLDNQPQLALGTGEGRERLLSLCAAVRAALRAGAGAGAGPHARRLAAVAQRLRRLAKARDQLTAALGRHLNNLLIHVGNESGAGRAGERRHHRELLPCAPLMRCLKLQDDKAFQALVKVYVSTWSRVYEREIKSACESAKNAIAASPATSADEVLDQVLSLVESLCNAEQDFCNQFFFLDVDLTSESSDGDGERSEKSESERAEGARRLSADSRRLMQDMFPALEPDLVALVGQLDKHHEYGSMVALSCISRLVLAGAGGAGGAGAGAGAGEQRWARGALAAGAVAAKRQADKLVADRIAAMPDAVKQASKKPKCGILSFISEFEQFCSSCEAIFGQGSRRADLERWYGALLNAMMAAVASAEHPRTPAAVIHTENYHRLHGVVSSLRVPALEGARRECRLRYSDALRQYVHHYFGRPLEKLTQFFERVSEAVSSGVREEEVCYRAAFSKHELRRILALYPAPEVRKSLHRLYRTVEKHFSSEGGLLQVVWRAMQEELIAQHVALQARIAACYPGAGLTLPLTTQDILDAFSDIAREH